MEPEPAGNHFWSNIYGNSENATIRARLRAEAMSKAVSSTIAVLFGSDVSPPNEDHAVWMPIPA
jgi:hypothetical protein